jgi:hypothetical protein
MNDAPPNMRNLDFLFLPIVESVNLTYRLRSHASHAPHANRLFLVHWYVSFCDDYKTILFLTLFSAHPSNVVPFPSHLHLLQPPPATSSSFTSKSPSASQQTEALLQSPPVASYPNPKRSPVSNIMKVAVAFTAVLALIATLGSVHAAPVDTAKDSEKSTSSCGAYDCFIM